MIAHNMANWTVRIGGLDTTDNDPHDDNLTATATTSVGTTAADDTAADTTGGDRPKRKSFVATDTLRRHHLRMPGRVASSGRKLTVHLPQRWPWADEFTTMLAHLRSVVVVT